MVLLSSAHAHCTNWHLIVHSMLLVVFSHDCDIKHTSLVVIKNHKNRIGAMLNVPEPSQVI